MVRGENDLTLFQAGVAAVHIFIQCTKEFNSLHIFSISHYTDVLNMKLLSIYTTGLQNMQLLLESFAQNSAYWGVCLVLQLLGMHLILFSKPLHFHYNFTNFQSPDLKFIMRWQWYCNPSYNFKFFRHRNFLLQCYRILQGLQCLLEWSNFKFFSYYNNT